MTKVSFLKMFFFIFFSPFLSLFSLAAQGRKNATVIYYSDQDNPVATSIHINYFFPAGTFSDTLIEFTGKRVVSLPVDQPVLADMALGDNIWFKLYLSPNDTLGVTVMHSGGGYNLEFSGPLSAINNYYKHKKNALGYYQSTDTSFHLSEGLEIRAGFAQIDTIQQQERRYLASQLQTLPDEFNQVEQEWIWIAAKAAKFTLAAKQHISFENLSMIDPELTQRIRQPANQQNIHSNAYMIYMNSFLYLKYAGSTLGHYTDKYRVIIKGMQQEQLPLSLQQDYHLFFLSFMIPQSGNREELGRIQQLWNELRNGFEGRKPLVVDSLIVSRGLVLMDSSYLKTGMIAPVIAFEKENGETASIEKLKGKIIYLDFWATWCVPCREDLKQKKDLGFDIFSDSVIVVNVCLNSPKSTWLDYLKTHRPVGLNWFAGATQTKQVLKDYNLIAYPHYVLIDPKGIVVENATYHPKEMIRYLEEKLKIKN